MVSKANRGKNMDRNRYIFDKRLMKKYFIKYAIIMLTLFPILIAVNILLSQFFDSGILFFDIMLGLVYILTIEIILHKIQVRKEEKIEEERIRAKREKKRRQIEEKSADVVEVKDVELKSGKKNNNKRGK